MSVPRVVENITTDKKTGQRIHFRCELKGRDKTVSSHAKGFSESQATSLLQSHLKKKKWNGYIYCLDDRIRFEKKGIGKLFREQLMYKDIKFIYLFSNIPDVIMFGIQDGKDQQTYETYTVDSMEERNKVVEVTQQKNPNGTVRTDATSRKSDMEYYSDKELSSVPGIRYKSRNSEYRYGSVVNDFTASTLLDYPLKSYLPTYSPPIQQTTRTTCYKPAYLEPVRRTPSPIQVRPNRYLYLERATSPEFYATQQTPMYQERIHTPRHYQSTYTTDHPRRSNSTSYITLDNADYLYPERTITPKYRQSVNAIEQNHNTRLRRNSSITYINSDNTEYPVITDNGPIYVYLERKRSQENIDYRRNSSSRPELSIYR